MTTRIGFAINVHYCGHQIAEISLASNPFGCGMETDQDKRFSKHTNFSKTPCCKDQILLLQNNEPQKFEIDSNLVLFGIEKSIQSECLFEVPTLFSNIASKIKYTTPPPKNKIFLLNHCFIIYG
jgi:hypothetical protein|tara:strand:+ start:118 stop:489 length:372 start_codon:yes stop_codon:yes gene_type:complete